VSNNYCVSGMIDHLFFYRKFYIVFMHQLYMADGRSRNERIKKWIKEQRDFGKKFQIETQATERRIKMRLKGWDNIAGLDTRAIKSMGYKNSPKMKIKQYSKKNDDYFEIWEKKKGVCW